MTVTLDQARLIGGTDVARRAVCGPVLAVPVAGGRA